MIATRCSVVRCIPQSLQSLALFWLLDFVLRVSDCSTFIIDHNSWWDSIEARERKVGVTMRNAQSRRAEQKSTASSQRPLRPNCFLTSLTCFHLHFCSTFCTLQCILDKTTNQSLELDFVRLKLDSGMFCYRIFIEKCVGNSLLKNWSPVFD